MRTLASLFVALLLACGANPAPPRGTWHIQSDPEPPVVGSAAGLFLEYVPAPGEGSRDPIVGRPSTIRATCAACGGLTVEVKAEPYPSLAAEKVSHPGATAGYTARITLPQPGEWQIAPFGGTITVRPVDDFEPPLIHVNYSSDPLDPGCGRREVAALLNGLVDAYNVGDAARLGALVQGAIDFSIAGGAVPFIATDRAAFLAGAASRHLAGERFTVTRVHVTNTRGKGGLDMAVYATRTAIDLPAGGQRLIGRAAMTCPQLQFIRLNLGVVQN